MYDHLGKPARQNITFHKVVVKIHFRQFEAFLGLRFEGVEEIQIGLTENMIQSI